jgi:NAD(P) transhydrogenase subunit alpha
MIIEEDAMKLGVPKELGSGERRVAVVPDALAALKKAGLEVLVQADAGAGAFLRDADYARGGATIVSDAASVLGEADIVAKVQSPCEQEATLIREGAVLISFLQPMQNLDVVRVLAGRKVSAFSVDLIPRISRAQSMDALSSQATASGYKAVLIAASSLVRFFPMLTTAAGTIFAAKVLVLGAGVAGLQAIATARRLGAVVWGYDVRPAVREQVESLGAKFLQFELGEASAEDKGGYAKQLSAETQQRQQEWLAEQISGFDVIITTALVPGKPAPRLITRQTVERMRPGSVIVDIAAEAGGNCELTQPGKAIEHQGVVIHGPLNLPSTVAAHASQMFARNITAIVSQIVREGALKIDLSDDVVRAALVTHSGEILHEVAKAALLSTAAGVTA